jgi:hypothetical protein
MNSLRGVRESVEESRNQGRPATILLLLLILVGLATRMGFLRLHGNRTWVRSAHAPPSRFGQIWIRPKFLRPCAGSSFRERLDRGSFVLLDIKHTGQFGDLQ